MAKIKKSLKFFYVSALSFVGGLFGINKLEAQENTTTDGSTGTEAGSNASGAAAGSLSAGAIAAGRSRHCRRVRSHDRQQYRPAYTRSCAGSAMGARVR